MALGKLSSNLTAAAAAEAAAVAAALVGGTHTRRTDDDDNGGPCSLSLLLLPPPPLLQAGRHAQSASHSHHYAFRGEGPQQRAERPLSFIVCVGAAHPGRSWHVQE